MLKVEKNHYFDKRSDAQFMRGIHGPEFSDMHSSGYWQDPGHSQGAVIIYWPKKYGCNSCGGPTGKHGEKVMEAFKKIPL